MIEAMNVTKYYGRYKALDDVSITVNSGQSVALLGRNGAGKTTFVKSVLGLLPLQAGTIKLDGTDVEKSTSRTRVAYMPEKFSFLPYYTLEGICEFYGQMKGLGGQQLEESVRNSLTRLQLNDIKNKKVKECSKGQLQRAGLAAMLVGDNELFILDEPFSGLDPIAIKELQTLLLSLKEQGKTLLINSHDLDHVKRVCDSMVILNEGSKIVQGEIDKLVGDKDLLDYFYDKVQCHE